MLCKFLKKEHENVCEIVGSVTFNLGIFKTLTTLE